MTNHIDVHIVRAFVDGDLGGNPAGVVIDADGLNEGQMLQIAKDVGLSETAFVSRSQTEGVKLDFFTPTKRIAHCGHATVATFSVLAQQGRFKEGWTSKETIDGPRRILIKAGEAYMEQLAPQYDFVGDWEDKSVDLPLILASLNLREDDLQDGLRPVRVYTGNKFLVIGVKDDQVLQDMNPNQDLIAEISAKLDLIGYYVFALSTGESGVDAETRMFAPFYGIPEEAATGMAAGPLACVLFDHYELKKTQIILGQGNYMMSKSPSRIKVDLDINQGKIMALMAGGAGKISETRKITIL